MSDNQIQSEGLNKKEMNTQGVTRKRTGLVTDPQFAEHLCPWDPDYPENPTRYNSILERVSEYGLTERCELVETSKISKKALLKKHTAEHVELLEKISNNEDIESMEYAASGFDAIYFNKYTYLTALLSAGSAINLVKAILDDQVQNGMAIIRPPGHHAMPSQYCGYCYFNNVALAAQHALDEQGVKKVLVVDWDVHHGQATQHMFYEDEKVLYFSIHRYQNGLFWPNLRESHFDHIGNNQGKGFNINIPLNETGCTDADYMYIFNNILMPVAYEFNPDLVLVSAGYDAALGCPEGRMCVTPACYAHMIHMLKTFASGKVAVLLEGGYFPPSLSESAAMTLAALLGDLPPRAVNIGTPKQSVRDVVLGAIYKLTPYWKCFESFNVPAQHFDLQNSEKFKVEVIFEGDDIDNVPPFPTRYCYLANSEDENQLYKLEIDRLKIGIENYQKYLPKVGLFNLGNRTQYDSASRNESDIGEHKRTEEFNKLINDVLTSRMIHVQTNKQEVSEESNILKKLVDEIYNDTLTSAIALISSTEPTDLYATNSIMDAAHYAIDNKEAERICIIDINNASNNKTQSNDGRILYFSINSSGQHNISADAFVKYNISIPFKSETVQDADYMEAYLKIVQPIIYSYQPDLILLRAGQGKLVKGSLDSSISPEMYGHIIQLLIPMCKGRIIFTIEDTSDLMYVSSTLTVCSKALLGDPLPTLNAERRSNPATTGTILNIIQDQKCYWNNLQPHVVLYSED